MISSPQESGRPVPIPLPSSWTTISAPGASTEQRTSISEGRACRTALFIDSWAMRRSSDSTSGRSRAVRSSAVTWIGIPELSLRCRARPPMAVPRLSLPSGVGAQGPHGPAHLADHAR